MLRIYKYNNCGEYHDFSNDLFRRPDKDIQFDFEKDLVTIDSEPFQLSSIVNIGNRNLQSSCTGANYFIKLKSDIKSCLKNILNC